MQRPSRLRSRVWVFAASLVLTTGVGAWPLRSADFRPEYKPAAYAIKAAKVIADSSTTFDPGTVVIRDGVVESVGVDDKIAVPFDAEVIDGKGLTVYPGFIDLYTNLGQPAGVNRSATGPGRTVNYADFALASTPPDNRNGLTPEFQVASVLEISEATAEERRALGFCDVLAAPGGSIATGQSALVSLGGQPRRESLVRSPVALHLNVKPPIEPTPPTPADATPGPRRRGGGGFERRYPSALMGAVAHLRQAMLDAEYAQRRQAHYDAKGGPRPAFDPALNALHAARAKAIPTWWEANTRDEIHRALDLADEFGTGCVIVGGREAGKVADRLKALDVPVVFRLDFPEEPKAPTEAEYRKQAPGEREDALKVLQDRASKWKEWVATPRDLAKSGVRFAFGSEGLTKSQTVNGQVRKVTAAGLSPQATLDALTRRAAEIAGLGERLGTIAPGKLGHVVAWTGAAGDEKSKPRYLFIDGQKFDLDKPGAAKKKGRRGGATDDAANTAETKTSPDPEKTGEPASKPETAKREVASNTEAVQPDSQPTTGETKAIETKAVTEKASLEDQPAEKPLVDVATEFDEARKPTTHTGGNALIRDATILTGTAAGGMIRKGSILVKAGKIAAIGENLLEAPGVTVIEGAGLVAMPGIIDTHSHMAIQGGVNEATLSIVPEVRVRDVVTGDEPTIYRALAGGATAARPLHGSANTIGGQDAVIKLRHGEAGRDLLIHGGPQGVKFALGENVTRSTGRFPNTRMGVEATIERAFEEGRAYRERWKAYEAELRGSAGTTPQAPRRDLRLEALAGILDGSIRVHSHCYRSDEILMLLGVAQRYGVRVRSLQHVLEGYKVAPEIAAHGASASTFSDWWAYKIEAKDAIPYNAALLTQAGVPVCIKSDSEELVRHLNLEAAKMMKYGGVTEAQALAMITLNPARELGLDGRMGTLEVGKDADIALFNGHPFNAFARCQMTLIDGEVWFQRNGGETPAKARAALPAALADSDATRRGVVIPENLERVYALTGATVHPVSGPDIPGGTVVVEAGRITAVGGPETPSPEGAQRVDLAGMDLWPGMVDAGSAIGLFEIGSLRETQDFADSAQFQPELRTSTALHPDSDVIPVTRANGVLAAYVQPSGGLIAGQGCVIDLDGWVPRELVIADRLAVHVNVPTYIPPLRPGEEPTTRPGGPNGPNGPNAGAGGGNEPTDPRQRRREQLEEIKEQFRRASVYDAVRKAAEARKGTSPDPDPRLDALAPYAQGVKPVVFHAEHRGEILDALKIAKDLKLKAIISGGREAWKVIDALKEAKVPVIVAGTLRLPEYATDPYDSVYANPARLSEAGIPFAICSKGAGSDLATNPRNLPYEAATACAFGLPEAEALKAVTLAPAQILGVADQLGSIEPGKRANLVVTAGHILQPTTEVKALVLNGKPLPPDSRQTRLYDRYRRRLAEVRAGRSPLGIDTTPPSDVAPSATPAIGGSEPGGSK